MDCRQCSFCSGRDARQDTGAAHTGDVPAAAFRLLGVIKPGDPQLGAKEAVRCG